MEIGGERKELLTSPVLSPIQFSPKEKKFPFPFYVVLSPTLCCRPRCLWSSVAQRCSSPTVCQGEWQGGGPPSSSCWGGQSKENKLPHKEFKIFHFVFLHILWETHCLNPEKGARTPTFKSQYFIIILRIRKYSYDI